MIPTALFAVVALSSLSFAGVNGAVFQRDGTFTYITPQPTAGGTASTSSTTTRPTTTATTTATTSVTITATTTPTTTATTTQTTTATTTPTTTATTTPTTTATTRPTTTATTTPTTTATTGTTFTPITTATTTPTIPVTTKPTTTGTTTTPTSTPGVGGSGNCNGVQQWQASFAYNAGDRVIFNGQLYTARQWTYNNAPPSHPDQWTAGGTCSTPINNKANCVGVAAWQSNVAYATGNLVTANGHLWSAVSWTQSNAPGDTSGSWKDLGACA